MAIYSRRDGWKVVIYAGIDPVTGRQRQISRQVQGSRKQAEREETRLKAEVMAGRHRGTAAKTLGEMVEFYLDWREYTGKPIGPQTIRSYRGLYEARIKPGLGKLRLPQVDPPTLDRFYTALRKSGSSASLASRCPPAGSATCRRSSPVRSDWQLATAGLPITLRR